MLACPERGSGVDAQDQLFISFGGYFLPGRNNADIIHSELMEVLFPVIHPVFLGCLVDLDQAITDVCEAGNIHKPLSDAPKQLLLAVCRFFAIYLRDFRVKSHAGLVVIKDRVGDDIPEVSAVLFRADRCLVLDLEARNAEIVQHSAHQVTGLLRCCDRIFHPFHNDSPPWTSRFSDQTA